MKGEEGKGLCTFRHERMWRRSGRRGQDLQVQVGGGGEGGRVDGEEGAGGERGGEGGGLDGYVQV